MGTRTVVPGRSCRAAPGNKCPVCSCLAKAAHTASRCPALLVRGRRSQVLAEWEAARMAAERPNTTLVTLDAGHSVHDDLLAEFAAAVDRFLDGVP